MSSIRSRTLTPMEYEILIALKNGRGRAGDIAKRARLDIRVTWQAMQRLLNKGLIEKDEFDVYNITEKGKAKLEELERDKVAQANVGLAKLSRLVENRDEKDINKLLSFVEKVTQEWGGGGEDRKPAEDS
jgi:predicted transcriptional regulator